LRPVSKTLLHLQEFDPYGLQHTYRDEASGAELPLFAVFDLEGSHQLAFEITTDSLPPNNQSRRLPAYLPFQKTQQFVRKINDRRTKSERVLTRPSGILGVFPKLSFLLSRTVSMVEPAVPYVFTGGWILGAFFSYLLGLLVLNRICPWKKLVITAEFNCILSHASTQ
jgi:hypothetical protein